MLNRFSQKKIVCLLRKELSDVIICCSNVKHEHRLQCTDKQEQKTTSEKWPPAYNGNHLKSQFQLLHIAQSYLLTTTTREQQGGC